MHAKIVLTVLVSMLLGQSLWAGEPHSFSVHDLMAFERLGEPAVSPDGKWVVYVRKIWDSKANKISASLWLVSTDGKLSHDLTSQKYKKDGSPIWSRDSRHVLFLSDRSGSQQIWSIRVGGGEARQISDFPVDVSNLRLSPDGSFLAFSAEVYPDLKDFEATKKRDKEKEESGSKAMIFDRLMVRHWDEWFTGKRNHIFVVPIKTAGSYNGGFEIAGTPLDLMQGIDGDAPTKPFGDVEEFGWSPDSLELAYTMQIGRDMAWTTDLNVYVVSRSGGQAKCISCENKATDKNPIYSPDGKWIAYLAMEKPGFEADRLRVKLYNRKDGKTHTLADAWDRSIGSMRWSLNGKTLIVTAEESARQKIFSLDVSSGRVSEVVGEHYNSALSLGTKGEIVFLQDSFNSPAEIWLATSRNSKKQLTHVNDERLSKALMSKPEGFEFRGAAGDKIQGWLFKPVGFKTQTQYPLAFLIHGGPQGAWTDHFGYRWNPQVFASAGYGVVMINFHGSTGFGQKFTDSISQDWGGKPYEDLMMGLDYVLANNAWIDKARVGALGASYGGFMINWINGNTDRFKCLVNHDGVFDAIGMAYSTDELWFDEWEHGGNAFENPEAYAKFSPARLVDKWKTPTLVIHGGRDYRISDSQGISTFTALQRKGIPSKLLYFPEENHWVLKPKNSIIWHQTVLDWLDQWLKKPSK